MIVRVSVVLNMTFVNSNSGYSYSMYYIIFMTVAIVIG